MKSLILCQPNSSKGCNACCGLFNIRDISFNNLNSILKTSHLDKNNKLSISEKREITTYICPDQGYISKIRPGCLLHPEVSNKKHLREKSLYKETICDSFLCPAHSLLSDKEKKIIIKFIDDWYPYSIAIIDPEFTSWLIKTLEDEYSIPFRSNSNLISDIFKKIYMLHSNYLNELKGEIFFYSIPEYNLGLNSRDKLEAINHKKKIRNKIESLIKPE